MDASALGVQIRQELRGRLERITIVSGKNASLLVNQALEEFLDRWETTPIDKEEAQRQSRNANAVVTEDEEFWMSQADTLGWE